MKKNLEVIFYIYILFRKFQYYLFISPSIFITLFKIKMKTIAGIDYNLGDRYDVKKLLGAGAYGHVALAIDKKD